MLRLFFALLPEADAAAAFLARVEPLLARYATKPVPASNLHATLCFVGAVAPERLAALCDAAARVRGTSATLTFDALDYWQKPRILCATERHPAGSAAAQALARQLSKSVIDAGFTPDQKPFRPHLTLARKVPPKLAAKEPWPRDLSPAFRFRCDRFVLMRSERGQRGSIYSVVASWPLDNAADTDKSR